MSNVSISNNTTLNNTECNNFKQTSLTMSNVRNMNIMKWDTTTNISEDIYSNKLQFAKRSYLSPNDPLWKQGPIVQGNSSGKKDLLFFA
jgi:hypothetical protein